MEFKKSAATGSKIVGGLTRFKGLVNVITVITLSFIDTPIRAEWTFGPSLLLSLYNFSVL